jgi:type I restriction enzyme S subunit
VNVRPSSLPSGWKKIQLGKLAQLSGRIGWKGLTAKEYTQEGPLFLSVHSLNYGDYVDYRDAFHISQARYNESPEIMLRTDDVLICKDGAGIGKLGIVGKLPSEVTINSSLLLVRAQDSILPKYLYYILSSPYFQDIVKSRLMGATTPHLYQRDISEFPIYLPPFPEQQRIVAILEDVFAKLAIVAANAEKNLKNSRELFDSYVNSIFLKEGEGWLGKQLGDVVVSVNTGPFGSLLHKSDYVDNGVPIVNPINIIEGVIVPDASKTVSVDTIRRLNAYKLSTNDIVVGRRGEIGRCAVVRNEQAGWLCGTGCFFIRTDQAVNADFLCHLLRSIVYSKKLERAATGTTMRNLSNIALQTFKISIPPLFEQNRFEKLFNEISKETQRAADVYEQKLASLSAIKQSVLQKAFSGELTDQSLLDDIVPLPGLDTKAASFAADILTIAYERHRLAGRESTFGHTKAQKLLHLVEAIAQIDLGRDPVKDAAGPNDFNHMLRATDWAEHREIFKFNKSDKRYIFQRLQNYKHGLEDAKRKTQRHSREIDGVIDLMLPMNSEEAEIVATVYASWNNLIAKSEPVNDEAIVRGAREDWHPAKMDIPRHKFFDAIGLLRAKEIIPSGRAKLVREKYLI